MSRADRQKRQQEEEALKLGREKLVPPDWLSPAAAAEFVRVVDEAGKLGLWDNLDVDCVAVYATAYVGYKEATAALAREGAVIERETREGYHEGYQSGVQDASGLCKADYDLQHEAGAVLD